MTLFGLIFILISLLGLLVSIVLACFRSTQKAAGYLALSCVAGLIIGVSVCSAFPLRFH